MKKVLLILIVLLSLDVMVYAESAITEGTSEIIEEYAQLYGKELEKTRGKLENVDFEGLVPGFDAVELLSDMVRGETVFSPGAILEKGIGILLGELRNTAGMLAVIMTVAVLCMYLMNLKNSLRGQGATDAAFFVCYLIIAGIAAAALMEVVGCGKVLVSNISIFMRMIVPVIMISLASGGAPVSATTFELVMIGIIEITEWIIEVFFIPMLMMSAALGIVNNLSESINAEKLVQFMNKTIKWGIGIVMTLFVGVMNLQGIVSGGADILAVKVTKFATSNLVPVVGGALAETVETVIGCGAVIKNSVGVLGIIMVVLMAAVPIFKIVACLIMFRLCAAVLQPISDKRIVKCMSELSDTVSGVMGLVTAVTVMFIIMLTIIINIAK